MENRKEKKLAKNTSILAISQFSSKILVFLLVPLYTSVLSTDEYGIYDLIVTTITLLYPILSLNIIDGVMRFLMDKMVDKKTVVSTAFRFVFYAIFIGCALITFLIFFKPIDAIVGLELYILVYYIVYLLNELLNQVSKGLEQIIDMGVAGIIGTISMILFNVLFLIILKLGIKGFFLAHIFGCLFPMLYLLFRTKIWHYMSFAIDCSLRKKMLAYTVPLIINTLVWTINSSADKYVVTFMVGIAEAGLISIAYKIPTILATIQNIFNQAWQISAVQEYEDKEDSNFFEEVFCFVNVVLCVACSLLMIFNKLISTFLFSNEFYVAWRFVPFLLVSCVINGSSGVLGAVLGARKDSRTMFFAGISGAVINILLNILFVYFIGVQGAIIATVVSSYVIFIIRKKRIAKAKIGRMYNWIMLTWIILIIQSSIEILITGIICYFLQGLLFVFIVLLYREQIKIVLKRFVSVLKKRRK